MKKRYLSVLAAGLLLAGGVITAQADVIVVPNFNGTASTTFDREVIFDATQASCYQKTYTIEEDFVDVSCVAGTCANDGTVSCNTFTDCLDSCVGLDNTQPLTTGYCNNGFGSRAYSQTCSDSDVSNCTERLNTGICRDSSGSCQVSANDAVDGTNPRCDGSATDTCLTGDPACILDNENQFLATGLCGDANGANRDVTTPCTVGGSDCDATAGTYCIPDGDINYLEDATCVTADGTDTGQSCYSTSDCRGSIFYDYMNPNIAPLNCTYSWDVTAGTGVIISTNGTDSLTVQYGAPGTYEAMLTMSVDDPENPGETVSVSRTTMVNPVDLPDPVTLNATFSTSYTAAACGNMTCDGGLNDGGACSSHDDCLGDGGSVADGGCYGECVGGTNAGLGCDGFLAVGETGPECPGAEASITIDTITAPAGLARAYVNWGDRSRDTIYEPEVSNSVDHRYSHDGTYNARVYLLGYDYNKATIILPIN